MEVINKKGEVIGYLEEVDGKVQLKTQDRTLQEEFEKAIQEKWEKTNVGGITIKKKIGIAEVKKSIESVEGFKIREVIKHG